MFNNNFGMNFGFCQKDNQCCPTICEQKCPEDPVYEAPIEKCVQKDFIHEVVHD